MVVNDTPDNAVVADVASRIAFMKGAGAYVRRAVSSRQHNLSNTEECLMSSQQSPIIIIGVQRSGTSMLTGMLRELGLFVGKLKIKKGRTTRYEAPFIKRINSWLLRQCGATWDHPESFSLLLENQEVCASAVDFTRHLMKSPRIVSYLGWRNFLRSRTLDSLDIPWGWKDSRTTFTLPIWLQLFPDAKVIHVYRHGVDVAASLRTKERDFVAARQPPWTLGANVREVRLSIRRMIRPDCFNFAFSLRCHSLEGAFSLWECYMREARRQIESVPNKAIEIRYETFLFDPAPHLRTLAEFCDLQASDAQIGKIADRVSSNRAFAFQSNAELKLFAERVEPRLAVFDY